MNENGNNIFKPTEEQETWLKEVVLPRSAEIATGKVKILNPEEALQRALEVTAPVPTESDKPTSQN